MDNRHTLPPDFSETTWRKLQPVLPELQRRHAIGPYTLRDVIKAMYYLVSRRCGWRTLPQDLPPWWIVYYYFYRWHRDGTWQRVYEALRGRGQEHNMPHGRTTKPVPPQAMPRLVTPALDAPWHTAPHAAPYVVNTLVRDVVALCQASAATRHVTFDLALSRQLAVVTLPPTGLASILFKLLRQVVTAGSVHLMVRTKVTPHGVQLTIHDHGCRFTPQPCRHASGPCVPPRPEHYHLEPALTEAHALLMPHGGHLSLAYQCEQGTTLTLTLPFHTP